MNKVNTLELPFPLLLGIGIFTRSLLFFLSIIVMGNSMHIVGFSVTELSSQRQLSAFGELMRGILLLWVFAFVQRQILFWPIVLMLINYSQLNSAVVRDNLRLYLISDMVGLMEVQCLFLFFP